IAQLPPLHASASGKRFPAVSVALPTAMHQPVAGQDTAASPPGAGVAAFWVGWTAALVPARLAASVVGVEAPWPPTISQRLAAGQATASSRLPAGSVGVCTAQRAPPHRSTNPEGPGSTLPTTAHARALRQVIVPTVPSRGGRAARQTVQRRPFQRSSRMPLALDPAAAQKRAAG